MTADDRMLVAVRVPARRPTTRAMPALECREAAIEQPTPFQVRDASLVSPPGMLVDLYA